MTWERNVDGEAAVAAEGWRGAAALRRGTTGAVGWWALSSLALWLLFGLWAPTAEASQRVALVIGNSAYAHSPLRNPVNDAADLARALRAQGFQQVLEVSDADLAGMRRALREFREALVEGIRWTGTPWCGRLTGLEWTYMDRVVLQEENGFSKKKSCGPIFGIFGGE